MSEQHSRGTSVVQTDDDDAFGSFFDLWFVPLWDLATLLLGSRDAGERAALDAMLDTRGVWDRLLVEGDPIGFARARVIRGRPSRPRTGAADPLWRVLDALDDDDRTALVVLVHERVSDAEAARLCGCSIEEVRARSARAVERARAQLAEEVPDATAFPESWLRLAMQRVAAERPPLDEPLARLARRRLDRRRARATRVTALLGLGVFVAGVAAFAGIVVGGAPGSRDGGRIEADRFVEERLGYRLSIAEGWRVQATLADPRGRGTFDPSRFGFATVEPSDETAAFIPEGARGPSALLTITVASGAYLDDVGALRDELSMRQRTDGTLVTAALVSVVERPATRFRVEHPDTPGSCPGCRSQVWSVLWFHGTTMTIEFSAFSQEAFNAFASDAEGMIRSIRPVDSDATLRYAPVSGAAREGIGSDATLEAVLQFMDARVRGAQAEVWLTPESSEAFRFDDRIGLYEPPTDGVYLGYQVVSRSLAPDGSPSFDVDLIVADRAGGEAASAVRERIVVGAGENVYGQPWPEAILSVARADTG